MDTLITAFQLVRTALAANANDEEYVDAPISREADLGAGIFLATGFGVSAIWGHVSTSQCASLKAERAPERAQDRPDASREATKAPPPERSPEPPPPTPPSPSWGR